MTRPIESDYTSQVAYTRALEAYCDGLPQLAQQEPVQYKCTVVDNQHPSGIPLEQWAKPQRTWVGLTDEEVLESWNEIRDGDWAPDFYAAIEAALRSKNT